MRPRIFTLEQAKALLPQVASALTKLQEKKRQIDLKQVEIDLLEIVNTGFSQAEGVPHQKIDQRIDGLNQLVAEYTKIFQVIENWGTVIKDVDQGLVDFYHVRDSELVFLCWRQGEPQLQYWHDLESGFQGRRAL